MSELDNNQPELNALSERTPLTPAAILGLLITMLLLAGAWYGTFTRIWSQWFPGWWMRDLPLLDRLTTGDSYYTHGPLVPIVSLAVAYYIYTRVGMPTKRTRASAFVGWAVFLFFLLTHLLFTFASVTFASGFALLGTITGLVIIWGGKPLLKAYALPIALLFFMIPLPLAWIDGINFELKVFATKSALWLAIHVFRIPAVVDGSYVLLAPDADGLPKTLVVENVCGGLRSIIALTYFAALFAALCRVTGLWRWVLLIFAFPVAIACNITRITSLVVAAHHLGTDAAGEHGWFHDISGILVFALALAFMFALESAILYTGKFLKRDWSDARLLGYLNNIHGVKGFTPSTRNPVVLGVLALSVVLCMYWVNRPEPAPMGGVAKQVLPASIDLGDATYTSSELVLEDQVLAILETDDYFYRRFTPEYQADKLNFDLLIVFSKNNRRGTHSPELCIQGSGERILDKGPVTVELADGKMLDMREVVSQDNRRMVYYLYVFKSGDSYTTNYTMQQAMILLHGLLNRETSGALIRLTVPVRNDDLDAARQLALQAASQMMPIIDKNLP